MQVQLLIFSVFVEIFEPAPDFLLRILRKAPIIGATVIRKPSIF